MLEAETTKQITNYNHVVQIAPTEKLPKATSQQLSTLKNALRRYEHFIGIASGEFSEAEIASDRQSFSHLLKFTADGQPIFVDEFAVEYIALITGLSLEQCAAVVYLDWVDTVASGLVSGDSAQLVEERYQALFG